VAATTIVITSPGWGGAILTGSSAQAASPTTATTLPTPPTTAPGAIITIDGGPNATANIKGPHNDPADFYGILLGLVAILVAIAVTRLIFRRPGGSGAEVEGPR